MNLLESMLAQFPLYTSIGTCYALPQEKEIFQHSKYVRIKRHYVYGPRQENSYA